jgi:hypothetical protein
MTIPIPCYSRKRQAWVVYDRPSRREALAHAAATMLNNECIPMVWTQQAGAFPTKEEAEASVPQQSTRPKAA